MMRKGQQKFFVIYQWNFSEIEVYFLPPLAPPKEGNDSPPSEGQGVVIRRKRLNS
jgi:hypothetical protein